MRPAELQTRGEQMFERLLIGAAALVASTVSASAYLDPGTGSLILQMLIAGALTAAATVRMFWARIKETARRFFASKPPNDPL